MRKLLMIAAFAAFAACAKQSEDVGETPAPQTDETTTTPPTDQTTPPADQPTPPADQPAPPTGYEPQPSTADTLQTPPGDSAAVERTIPDTSATGTGKWGDTSATTAPSTPTTDSVMTTAPDSL
jgi:hypothetical protein